MPQGKRSLADLPSTNAERLRRNLPLKPPMRRDGTRAARSSPSAMPTKSQAPVTYVANIYAEQNGSMLGYLQCDTSCILIPAAQKSNATTVSFSPNGTTPFDLLLLNNNTQLNAIGGLVLEKSGDLGTGSSAAAMLELVAPSKAGSFPPNAVQQFTESAIWTYSSSQKLTPSWTTSANLTHEVAIMMDPHSGALYLTGDIDVFKTEHGAASPGPLSFVASIAVEGA
ncbi:hypothetical protein CALCODRAFT_480338 [Calocera cornea HHB12733]|uniref:Uncharacterized protein n=1 Tax=Calocera cornea HHB12733 TaxID=1353952 RepID=A0A165IT43_9BASI|nr:hypothetical protein CALCODRAFT_480338 [Calocera cornea HHB12733]